MTRLPSHAVNVLDVDMHYSPAESDSYQATVNTLDTAMHYSPAESDRYQVSIRTLDVTMELKSI